MDDQGLAYSVAEDLIALAEEAYNEEADEQDAPIEDASCDADGVCHWQICNAAGCIIDKYHRGLALQTQAIAAHPTGSRTDG